MTQSFSIEHDGENWRTVFPAPFAEHAHAHATVEDAASHLLAVVRELGPVVDTPVEA